MLRTKRLTLRGPRQSDLQPMFAIYSDPINVAYWSTSPHADVATTQEILDGKIADFAQYPVNFILDLDGEMIGHAGMFRQWEVGVMLHRPYHRKGYVTEAMSAIIPYIWASTDAPVLTGDVDPRNSASVGLFHKLGFHETHRKKDTFCIDGVWSDSVYFVLERPIPATGDPNSQ